MMNETTILKAIKIGSLIAMIGIGGYKIIQNRRDKLNQHPAKIEGTV